MPVLNDLAALFVGADPVAAIYRGSGKVWPRPNYLEEVLADSPLGVWLMDEAAGTTMADSSGNANHGSFSSSGMTHRGTGPSSALPYAMQFSGTGSHAQVAVDLSALGSGAAVTLEGWWYVPSWPGATGFFAEYTPNWNFASGFGLATTTSGGGRLEYGISRYPGGFRTRSATRPLVGWHFYSVVFDRAAGDAGLISLRIDGMEQPSTVLSDQVASASPFANSILYFMSRGASSARLAGSACGVALYPGRLSNARRDAHYWSSAPAADVVREGLYFGGPYTTSGKWAGIGRHTASGKLYAAPTLNHPFYLVIDPATDTATQIGKTADQIGCIEGADGRMWSPPEGFNVPYKVLALDPATDTISEVGAAFSPGEGWYDGVLDPNGCIYCAPLGASGVLRIDTVAGTRSVIGSVSTSSHWGGAVRASNGMIYCPPRSNPADAAGILKIDPATDTVTQIGTSLAAVARAWSRGVQDPVSGRIYFLPKTETRLLVLDPSDDSYYFVSGLPGGADKWDGITLLSSGLIACWPRTRRDVLVIDPATDTWGTVPIATHDVGSGSAFCGAIRVGQDIYQVPFDAPRVLKWTER